MQIKIKSLFVLLNFIFCRPLIAPATRGGPGVGHGLGLGLALGLGACGWSRPLPMTLQFVWPAEAADRPSEV